MEKTKSLKKDSNDIVRYLILGISTVVIIVFFARFCAKPNTFSVTFDGYLSSSTITVEKDGTVSEPTTPKRAGYIFKGWYLNGKPFDFSTKVNKNITLEAVWEEEGSKDTYTVTFVTFDGSFTKEVPSGSTVEMPTCEKYEDNTCKGWYLENSLYDFSTPVTKDIVLEARYEYAGGDTDEDVKPNPNKDNKNNNGNKKPNKPNKDKTAPDNFTPSLVISTDRVEVSASTTDNKTSQDKLKYEYSLDGKNYQTSNTFAGLTNNKEYTVYVKVTDEDGNSTVVKRVFTTDKIDKPELDSVSNTRPTTEDVVISVKESSYPMYYSLDNGNTWNEVDGDITVTENTNVLVKANDGSSDSEVLEIPVNNIDREAPNSYEPTINKTSKSIEVTGTTTDNGGGNVTYEYKLNDGDYSSNNTFNNLTTGTYTITVKLTDELGNSREIVKEVEVLPPAKPEVSISNTNMTNEDVVVTVTNGDGYTIECLDGNDYVTCESTKTFTENGSITYRFTDGINTGESKEVVVNNIDKVAPNDFTITVSDQTTRSLKANGSTTDNVTEELIYSYKVDNNEYQSDNFLDKITTGNHTVYMKATDEAGNETVASLDVVMESLPSIALSQDRTSVTKENVIVTVTNNSSFATEYSLNNGEYELVSERNEIVIERNALVNVRTTDGFNSGEVASLNITNIDKEAPVINSLGITKNTRQIFLNIDATDDREAPLTYQYQKNDEGFRTTSDFGYLTTGTYTISVKAIDEAGNETVKSEEVVLEPLKVPSLTINHTTWTNEQIKLVLTDEDKAYKESNNLRLQFSLDGGSYGNMNSTYQMGNGIIKFRYTDGTNYGEDKEFIVDYYDDIAPTGLESSYEKTTNSITVSANATDDKTEVTYKYKLDNGALQDSNVLTGVTTGNHNITTYAYDLAGNYSSKTDPITIDPVPVPAIESSNTNLTNQNIYLSCTNKGDFTLEYSTDGTNYTELSNNLEVSENNTYRFRLSDGVNYSNINTFEVNNIDKESPLITGRDYTTTSKSITMNYTATDNMSTNLTYEYKIGNDVYNTNVIDNLRTGTYAVTVKVTDEAGNSTEEVVNIEVEPIAKPEYTITPDTMTKDDVTVSITNKVTSQGNFDIEVKEGNDFVSGTESIIVSENKTLEVRFTDGINYSEVTNIVISNIDKLPPYEFVPDTVLTTSTVTINASTTDNMSTNITYSYRLDYDEYQSNNYYEGLALGNHTIYVKATDEVGNERIVSKDIEIISIPLPEVTYQKFSGNWINTKEVAEVTNKDIYTVEYKINDGEYTSITGNTFDIEDNSTVYIRLTNGTHYSDTYTKIISYIDRINPFINSLSISNKTSNSMTVNVDGGDNESGISWYIYEFDNQETPLSATSYTINELAPETEYTIKVTARDRAGNTYTKEITDSTLGAQSLYSTIVANVLDEEINLNEVSSNVNGRGLYKTNDDIYYYRGETDNYVILGDKCFNIVRTTNNGGVKLIYRGAATNGMCSQSGADATIGTTKYSNKTNPFVNDTDYLTNNYTYHFMDLSNQSTSIRYGDGYTYENGIYTLTNSISSSSWLEDENYTNREIGSTYKYTCFNTDSCSTLYYIIYSGKDEGAYYIELSNGETLESVKNNIFNTSLDSNVKTVLENWYQSNMSSYSNIIIDEPFCVNKNIDNNADLAFLNSDNNNLNDGGISFNSSRSVSLSCNNEYSVSNGKLTYPVGLITRDEYIFAGGVEDPNSATDSYLNIGVTEYTMTPDGFYYGPLGIGGSVYTIGNFLGYGNLDEEYYIRPVITINNEVLVTRGNGTSTSPYILYTE